MVLSLSARVARNPGVLFRGLPSELVLLNPATGFYYGLDRVGARIWELLELHDRPSEVLSQLVREYDVDESVARVDLLRVLGEMVEKDLVRLSDESSG